MNAITEFKETLRRIDLLGQEAAQYPLLLSEAMPQAMRKEACQILDEVKRHFSNAERKALATAAERSKSMAYFYVLGRTQNEVLAKAVALDAAMLREAEELGVGYADAVHVLRLAYGAGRLPVRADFAEVHNARKSSR